MLIVDVMMKVKTPSSPDCCALQLLTLAGDCNESENGMTHKTGKFKFQLTTNTSNQLDNEWWQGEGAYLYTPNHNNQVIYLQSFSKGFKKRKLGRFCIL